VKREKRVNSSDCNQPIMKKFPGRFFSLKLLYVRSNTSRTGNAPKPRGSTSNRFILPEVKRSNKFLSRHKFQIAARPVNCTNPAFKILNFGICDREIGSSVMWLLKRFRISRLTRFARPGGTTVSKTTWWINWITIRQSWRPLHSYLEFYCDLMSISLY